jgi:phytoene/squalene synthetase
MRTLEQYRGQLEAVSRSFAVCIPRLDPPFRDQVALAYLLFRVLDTVEDAPFDDRRLQQRQFDRLRSFLRAMPARAEVDAFASAFPAAISDAERVLLRDAFALFEDGHSLEAPARHVMFGAIDRMASGMAAYTRRPSPLHLVDLEDVCRYCCLVAGLVGEMLTRLWAIGRDDPAPEMLLAYHFGLFLQKVNILKDRETDEHVGRFFVPDRTALLSSLRGDAVHALRYLHALPRAERGYRTFCAWALMMGAAALGRLDLPKQHPKPSHRAETAELLARTQAIIDDDDALARQFTELMPVLPTAARAIPRDKPETLDWFRRTLAAPLTELELGSLGIVARP